MLLIRREPDHVTGPNLLNRASLALRQAAASRYDQGLAQRVGVPCSPRARFKRDTCAGRACRVGWLEQRVNAYSVGKTLSRSFAEGL
jgi:hypothetical protein